MRCLCARRVWAVAGGVAEVACNVSTGAVCGHEEEWVAEERGATGADNGTLVCISSLIAAVTLALATGAGGPVAPTPQTFLPIAWQVQGRGAGGIARRRRPESGRPRPGVYAGRAARRGHLPLAPGRDALPDVGGRGGTGECVPHHSTAAGRRTKKGAGHCARPLRVPTVDSLATTVPGDTDTVP